MKDKLKEFWEVNKKDLQEAPIKDKVGLTFFIPGLILFLLLGVVILFKALFAAPFLTLFLTLFTLSIILMFIGGCLLLGGE